MPRPDVDRVVLHAYGCSVAVELPHSQTAWLSASMPPGYRVDSHDQVAQRCWRIAEAPDGAMQAFVEGGVLITDTDTSVVLETLMSDIELWVAEHSPERVFLHAGCVAVDDRAIVMPGLTMAGKSSLVAALIEAGAAYYSDEYTLVDSDGWVWPYARPLCIRPSEGGPSRRVSHIDLGGVAGRGPIRIGLVAALRYDHEAGWDVGELTQGEAVLSLIANAVAARRSPEAVLTALVAATEGVAALSGTRNEGEDAALQLLHRLSPQPAWARPIVSQFADSAL